MTSNENARPDADEEEPIIREDLGSLRLQDSSTPVIDPPPVPVLFTSVPPIRDNLTTETSVSQDNTVEDCVCYLAGYGRSLFSLNTHGLPMLNREDHIDFLQDAIQDAKYIPYDASRPWVVYWSLTGLSLLGEDVEKYQERYTL